MGPTGTLEISAFCENDATVKVSFSDTGTGFAPSDSQTIFEPFYTTKQQGKGTGLGLAICKDLVERMGGKIIAENRPTKGSIFTVILPNRRQNRLTGNK
jgi:signal transduction histidine kinase